MTMGLMFYILMLVWLIWGAAVNWSTLKDQSFRPGPSLLIFILFLLLGWKVFGSPIQG